MMKSDSDQASVRSVHVEIDSIKLEGDLTIPVNPRGVVLFAHGSGSSRFSSRNRSVAQSLNRAGFATLLIDLLTRDEEQIDERTRHLRFDIEMLADRLIGTIDWLKRDPQTNNLPIGLFGASTGGGAALVAAALRPDDVSAVVSRGGRPDLAGQSLSKVRAPTLLIVGGNDPIVIDLNQQAMRSLKCENKLEIVPNATHLFEEPGALETVASLAQNWFDRHLKT